MRIDLTVRRLLAVLSTLLVPVTLGLTTSPRMEAQEKGVRAQQGPQPVGGDASSPAAFEVASIKRNRSGERSMTISMPPGGRFTAINAPVRQLLQQSYGLQPFQIVGGPSWMTSDRYDIVAKPPDGVTSEQARPMVRALLADRFKLKAHMEAREMPVYELVLARSDGKLGPNLNAAKPDCAAFARGRPADPPPAPPPARRPGECGIMTGAGSINADGQPIAALARALGPLLNRLVIDKTGLTSTYDFQVTFTPEGRGGSPGPLPGVPPTGADTPARDPNSASLVTALQEQLGLKLNSQKGPVEMLVIDSIEPPTED